VVYSFLHTTKDLGDPGSSRGTLERVRVDLTIYAPYAASNISVEFLNDFKR
jgi:hypothetical protein